MMNNRGKYLFKNTAIFALGNLATRLVTFFLVPLYTNVLSTTEYGIIDLIVTIGTLAIPIVTMNISESVMRFNLDKDSDKEKITKVGIFVLIIGSILGLILIPICGLFEDVAKLGIMIYFYVIVSAASQIFLCDLRGKELLIEYSIGNVINTLFIVGFNIIFLVVMRCGISGYLMSYIIANSVVLIYSMIVGRGYKAFFYSLDCKMMLNMLKYSVVLIPNSFMWWIMNFSDHLMVTSKLGPAANGIYAISYKIPTLISTLTQIFNQAWSYSAIKEKGATDEEAYNNQVFHMLISVVMFLGILMMTIIKPFMKIYVNEQYYDAWKYTPFLIIGCVYLTLGSFIATTYSVNKDSKGFLVSGLFGAVVNILLNIILIPVIGIYGAAIATCISYISVLSFRLIHTRKYICYRIITKSFILGTILMAISTILMFVENITGQILQCIILMLSCVIFKEVWLPYFKAILFKRRGGENVE